MRLEPMPLRQYLGQSMQHIGPWAYKKTANIRKMDIGRDCIFFTEILFGEVGSDD